MKENGIERDEFAREVGVGKSTVDCWLATGLARKIPEKKMVLIEAYMERVEQAKKVRKEEDGEERIVYAMLNDEQYAMCLAAAQECKLRMRDFAEVALMKYSTEILRRQDGEEKESI